MSIGQKFKFTGTVARQIVAKGSKSEHEAIVLQQDGTSSPPLKIRIQGGNPFSDKALEPFVGKRVSFEAVVAPAGIPSVIVEKLSDISIITRPSNKSSKNNGPKV